MLGMSLLDVRLAGNPRPTMSRRSLCSPVHSNGNSPVMVLQKTFKKRTRWTPKSGDLIAWWSGEYVRLICLDRRPLISVRGRKLCPVNRYEQRKRTFGLEVRLLGKYVRLIGRFTASYCLARPKELRKTNGS